MSWHIQIFLETSVSLRILEYQQRGGPTDSDFDRIYETCDVLCERGDDLIFGNENRGKVAKLANMLADALAVMAFLPGGVDVFGSHFEALP